MPSERKKKAEININKVYCKGCGICVELCPADVLAMQHGKAEVVQLEACTLCEQCELRCPDFAITVRERNLP